MKKYLIDTHCHLNYPGIKERLVEVMQNANNANVRIMQTICTQRRDIEEIKKIVQQYENVFYSIGIHPLNVKDEKLITSDELISLIQQDSKISSIGETGLDYYKEKDENILFLQRKSFVAHIVASQKTGLPIIIHTRDAEDDTLKIIKENMMKKSFSGVLHCFTGTYELASTCIEMGLFISASGVITFKNSDTLREVFKKLPIESILIETDAPFLAPAPYRGKVNEPAYIVEIVKKLSEIKNISYDEIISITTQNALKLFNVCNNALINSSD